MPGLAAVTAAVADLSVVMAGAMAAAGLTAVEAVVGLTAVKAAVADVTVVAGLTALVAAMH